MNENVFEPGTMTLGVNYWASHAATEMWTRWNADVVEADLQHISELGCRLLRVFPRWDDFQPIMVLRTNCFKGGFRHSWAFVGEKPLPVTEAGMAGVDEVMMQRFETLADLAEKYHLRLIVPLINGHMTFRIYNPPAVDGLDHFTDPDSLMWQIKFISYFVKRMKNHPAIYAWELGNESNCLSQTESRAAAWNWTAQITNSIRANDSDHPVLSGMHSLELSHKRTGTSIKPWLIQDQAELCDILTTHPYPMWRDYINCDPTNTLRWSIFPATENTLYSGVSGKQCFVEEIGTLRRTFSNFHDLGRQLGSILWLLWANDGLALLWWCAFEQTGMEFPPYDWDEACMEHGIMMPDYGVTPTGQAIGSFSRFLELSPVKALPKPLHNAVCVLGYQADHYQLAVATDIPAKQAGLHLNFHYCEDPLPDSQFYLIPCVRRKGGLSRSQYRQLMQAAENGATVYFSFDYDVCIPEMETFFGLEITSREKENCQYSICLSDTEIPLTLEYRFLISSHGAEKIDTDGFIWEYKKGRGRIVVATLPAEKIMLKESLSYQTKPFWKFYEYLAKDVLANRVIYHCNSEIIVSEHEENERRRYAVVCNCSPNTIQEPLTITAGWKISGCSSNCEEVHLDRDMLLSLPGNAGALLVIERLQI